MPVIAHWFDTPQFFEWETMESSFTTEYSGSRFSTYPLYWLLPYVYLTPEDIESAPSPLWVTEIHPDSKLGVINNEGEGTYIVPLGTSYGAYFDSLQSSHRKRYRAVLRKNEDLEISEGSQGDIDALWHPYTSRLSVLTTREGADVYTEEELQIRRDFYRSKDIRILSMKVDGVLCAVNVSLWNNGTVYDLACLIDTELPVATRSLGSFAILKNIELAVESGMESYDLLSRDYGYKRSYGAHEVKLKHYVKADDSFKKEYSIIYP